MRGERTDRLATQLQQEVATILQQELKDPSLGFVTITRAEVTRDFSHAKIFYSCLGSEADREHSQKALDRSARFIYGLIKKRFHLKVIPQLHFHYDQSIECSIALEETFERIKPPSGPPKK